MSALTTGLALSAALTLGLAAGKGGAVQVNGLSITPPKKWEQSVEDGTHKWEGSGGKESFSFDVFRPEGAELGAGECVDKLVSAVGGEGWERLVVGGQPAAKRSSTDELEDGRKVRTHTHVGCDGKTRWALTYVVDAKLKAKPQVEKVVSSIRFTSADAKKGDSK